MHVLEAVEITLQWDDLRNLTQHMRNDGERLHEVGITHVSDVLRHIAIKHKLYTEEDKGDDMPLMVLLGLAWEEYCLRLYKNVQWQPGQLVWDGIVGSPDGIDHGDMSIYPIGMVVDECKYTGKSQRIKGGTEAELKDIRTEWSWMHQGMAYVNLLRFVLPDVYGELNKCRYHVCWKYGNYARPFREKYMRYTVEFSDEELRGNWAMLQTVKDELL